MLKQLAWDIDFLYRRLFNTAEQMKRRSYSGCSGGSMHTKANCELPIFPGPPPVYLKWHDHVQLI